MEYKIRKIVTRNDVIDILEIPYPSDCPKKGGDIVFLNKPPIPLLSAVTCLFENCRVFSVLSVQDDEIVIKV